MFVTLLVYRKGVDGRRRRKVDGRRKKVEGRRRRKVEGKVFNKKRGLTGGGGVQGSKERKNFP